MSFPRNLFRFFIYSNLFIAFCAVVMVYQTCQLLLGIKPSIYFVAFVFFATICSYSFHWYLSPTDIVKNSPRTAWLSRNKNVHLILFFTGLTGVMASALFLLDHWLWLLLSAFITFLYSAPKIPHPQFRLLRKVALAKTLFLAFVWMYVTTVLPLLVSNRHWQPDFTWFAAARFFLIYAICILFDYRDREYDKSIGIRSLITWLSEKKINFLFIFSMLCFLLFTVCLAWFDYSFQAIGLLLIPGLITAGLYSYAKKNFSDILYYFVLDGLMALSSVLTLIWPYAKH